MTARHGVPNTEQTRFAVASVMKMAILGHGGTDPGASTDVSHHRAATTTIVLLCNHDRGSWAVTKRLTAELGLTDPRT